MDVACLAPAMLGAAVCVVGDALGTLKDVSDRAWLRSAVDSLTHGLVGAVSWEAVVVGQIPIRTQLLQSLLAGALAMVIDVDHFIMAGSLELKAALSLPRRPPFHATSIIPVIALVLWLLQTKVSWFCGLSSQLPWLFSVSWLSHHIRDGTRRGLWFWPLGSTAPLPTWLYLGGVAVLPIVTRLILSQLPGHVEVRATNFTTLHL